MKKSKNHDDKMQRAERKTRGSRQAQAVAPYHRAWDLEMRLQADQRGMLSALFFGLRVSFVFSLRVVIEHPVRRGL